MIFETVIEIKGSKISTIPKGTRFTLSPIQFDFFKPRMTRMKWYANVGEIYSFCIGLPVDSLFNDEFQPVMGNDFEI